MDIDGELATTMRRLIAAAPTDQEAERMLRQAMRSWAEVLPTGYLVQVGQLLLQSYLDGQREEAEAN